MKMKSDRLNILTIMTDQHSSHVMGCYGNEIVRTPNLDRLASEGMKFTDAYCTSPLCVPSRMSFMTSRTPTRNRVWNNSNILSSGTTTWAVCDAVCSLMDFGVTFADIASAEHLPNRDGRSLWPTLCGNHPDTWVNETCSELAGDHGGLAPSRMIRSGRWKLWLTMDCDPGQECLPPALFNLEEDPDELHDLGRDPEYADIREKLLEKLSTGWDTETIRADAEDANESYRRLAAWGRAVAPIYPDMMVFPPPEYEADVELL